MLSRVLPVGRGGRARTGPRSPAALPGFERVALVQPQRLQVLDQPLEQPDVQPAHLVDEAGVLLGDELDRVTTGSGPLGGLPAEQVDRPGQDREAEVDRLAGSSLFIMPARAVEPDREDCCGWRDSAAPRARRAPPRSTAVRPMRNAVACRGRPRSPSRSRSAHPAHRRLEPVAQAHAGTHRAEQRSPLRSTRMARMPRRRR